MKDLTPVEYYLREYALTKAQMDALKGELDKLYSVKSTAESILDAVESDESAGAISAEIHQVSNMLLREIHEVAERYEKVAEMITSLDDPEMRVVFEYRYFEQMAFWKIAKKLNISDSKVKALHKSGLEIINGEYHITDVMAGDSAPRPR